MTNELKALAAQKTEAAAVSGHAVAKFGKGSAEHLAAYSAFKTAKNRYEAACKAAGVEAYVTYDD